MDQKTSGTPLKGFMDKELGDRPLKQYVTIIKMPLMALIGLSIINFLIGLLGYVPVIGGILGLLAIPLSILIFLATIILAGYIGYTTVKKYSGNLLTAAIAGAVAGVILGLVGGILSLLNAVLSLAFGFGALGAFVLMGAIIRVIVSPIIGAVIGAILSIIGGAIAGSTTFETKKTTPQQKT